MIADKLKSNLQNSSWIRKMFEEGAKLRKIYGAENVFDFSIGNPDVLPPEEVIESIKKLASQENIHKYMPNAGFPDVREKIAANVSEKHNMSLNADNIIMTVGAAGGINVALKAILNPGDEVICLAPYFVEYGFYIANHGGVIKVVNTIDGTFQIDIEAIAEAINEKTKAIILNSPNNPTGVIYTEESLKKLSILLDKKQAQFGTKICVISDEPYAEIIYENAEVPSILSIFRNSVIVNSYSKSLSLPGERIGYIAINPNIYQVDIIIAAMIFANRTLGFVNAPSLIQKAIADNMDCKVDALIYEKRRDLLYNHLTSIGFSCPKPSGAFYLFVKSPIEDDVEFVKSATKYNVLLVPGTGFGYPGYFRISYCIDESIIKNSFDALTKIAKEYNLI